MATAGSVNIVMTAEASAFTAALQKGEHALHSFATDAEGLGEKLKGSFEALPGLLNGGGGIQNILGGVTSGLSKMASSAGEALSALGPVGLALGAVAGGAAVAATAVVGLVLAMKEFIEPQMEVIDQTAKLADRLGATTEGFVGLQHGANLAGVSSEELTTGLEHMLKTLGATGSEGRTAQAALARIGLSAGQLKNMKAEDQFAAIADGIRKIPNAAERGAAAMDIFGRAGQRMLPLMMEGAEGIHEAEEEAKKLGLTFSRVDAAKVEEANDAMTRVKEAVGGIGTQMATVAAPAITMLAQEILGVMPSAETSKEFMTGAMRLVANAVEAVVNTVLVLEKVAYGLSDAFATPIRLTLTACEKLAESIVSVMNLIPGVHIEPPKSLKAVADYMDNLHAQAKAKWNQPLFDGDKWFSDAAASARAATRDITQKAKFAEAQQAADEAGKKIGDVLQKATDDLNFQKALNSDIGIKLHLEGLSDAELKKLYDLRQGGASDAQAQQFEQTALAIQHMKDAAKGAEAMNDMRNHLRDLQDAAAKGIDPKLAEEVRKLHLDPGAAQQYVDLANGIKKLENAAKVKDRLKDLREEIQGLKQGLSQGQIDIKKMGGSDADVAAEGALEKQKKLREDINAMTKEGESAQDKYNDKVEELNEALKQGMITREQFNKLSQAAKDELDKSEKKDKKKDKKDEDIKVEERRFAFTAVNPKDDSIEQTAKDSLKEQKQQTRWLRESRDAVVKLAGDEGDVVDI